jgi:bisanhydrobacterioruberin hydratase
MDLIKTFANNFGVYLPVIGAILFAAPSYYGTVKQLKLKGFLLLLSLSAFIIFLPTVLIEFKLFNNTIAFSDALGPKLLGATPIIVGLVYPPLLLTTFWLASKFTRGIGRVFIGAVLVVIMHLVLDPATIKLELIQEGMDGIFYQMPLINFVVWFFVGIIGILIAHVFWGKSKRVEAPVAYSGLGLLLFWTGVNAGVVQRIPLSIGAVYTLVLLGIIVLEKQQFKKEK